MRILWIVNTVFPDLAAQLGTAAPIYGGWMYSLAAELAQHENITLAVATENPAGQFISIKVDGVQFFLLSTSKAADWSRVVGEFRPDIVHIHGTEFEYGMRLIRHQPLLKYVVSIQGLVTACHRHYLAGLEWLAIVRSITFRDIVRADTLFNQQHSFYLRGKTEREYIRRAHAIIGRTEWDRAHVFAIESRARYLICHENLRSEFYSNEHIWDPGSCERHSIFLSQAAYPIKGLHQVMKAIALLVGEFPSLKVVVAGEDFMAAATLRQRTRLSGYGNYVRRLAKRLNVLQHFHFTGPLSAQQMRTAYLRSHVFVCPSSVENSPNSLGEAQILGVPVVATFAGGIPSLVRSGETALLYPFEEYEVLAHALRKLFTDDKLALRLSHNARREAADRHDRAKNASCIAKIYSTMICWEGNA